MFKDGQQFRLGFLAVNWEIAGGLATLAVAAAEYVQYQGTICGAYFFT